MKTSLRISTLVFVLSTAITQMACAHERILDVAANVEITRDVFLERIGKSEEIVVGEKHDTDSIQNAEAALFTDWSRLRAEPVTFAWEFWNWSEKATLDNAYNLYQTDKITGDAFLKMVFGQDNPELTYLPLMEAVKASGADIIPTNLTRGEKMPVTLGGLSKLDPSLLPPGFALGGADYHDRFIAAMGGHGDVSTLDNYFASQSLVDDVAAYHFTKDRLTASAFLVIGNFHTRYFDGVWKRLELRSTAKSRTLVEIANESDEDDWSVVLHDPKYGSLADYVIFADY